MCFWSDVRGMSIVCQRASATTAQCICQGNDNTHTHTHNRNVLCLKCFASVCSPHLHHRIYRSRSHIKWTQKRFDENAENDAYDAAAPNPNEFPTRNPIQHSHSGNYTFLALNCFDWFVRRRKKNIQFSLRSVNGFVVPQVLPVNATMKGTTKCEFERNHQLVQWHFRSCRHRVNFFF